MRVASFEVPDGFYKRLKSIAVENGRSVPVQILHCAHQALGDVSSAPTLVHSEELGDMLFMPSGKIASVSGRVLLRFCDGKLPIGSVNWDKSFDSLAEAAEAAGHVVARYLLVGLVVEDHALWYEMYKKYTSK